MIQVNVKNANRKIGNNVQDFLLEVATELSNQMMLEAPVGATAHLRQSIQILGVEPGVVYVGTNLGYAPHVQFGTDPHWVPLEPLRKWTRRKLGMEELAYPIQQKIAKEGTESNEFVTRAIQNLKQEFI